MYKRQGEDQEQASIRYLYEIANVLPGFLEERGFTAESAQGVKLSTSDQLNDDVKPYYRDYICGTSEYGYQSLHITFYDNLSLIHIFIQFGLLEQSRLNEENLALEQLIKENAKQYELSLIHI